MSPIDEKKKSTSQSHLTNKYAGHFPCFLLNRKEKNIFQKLILLSSSGKNMKPTL
jgi:hypothetical protein